MTETRGRPQKVVAFPAGDPPEDVLRRSAFSRYLGVDPRFISDWISRGYLAEVLREDGRIEVRPGVEALGAAGVLSRDLAALEPPPGVPDGTLSTDEAERLDANLKVHQRMLEVRRRRGELLDRAKGRHLVSRDRVPASAQRRRGGGRPSASASSARGRAKSARV
jgi:hypothetical protein